MNSNRVISERNTIGSIIPAGDKKNFSLQNRSIQSWAKKITFKLLGAIKEGQLHLEEDGSVNSFGSQGPLQVRLTVKDPALYPAIVFGGPVGAAESYIEGHWEADDLTALIRIMVLNMTLLENMKGGLVFLANTHRIVQHLLRRNTLSRAKKNIISHYDLGNEFYQSFLDPTMMYSSAIYPFPTSTLEEAALFKVKHICQKMQLGPSDHIIEIGSGWGGFAIYAATYYGCHVTTTTISEAQYHEARKRIRKANLTDKITLLRQDYRDLQGSFDKLVSIEMIEAVGYNYLSLFFEKCSELLKPDGMLLLQAITLRDQKYKAYLNHVDFIQEHIFPGGSLVSSSVMLEMLREKTDMVVTGLEDFGFDYARTLHDWRKRFLAQSQFLEKYGFDERFKRLWEYYLCYCEGGFLERTISVIQLIAAKPANRAEIRSGILNSSFKKSS